MDTKITANPHKLKEDSAGSSTGTMHSEKTYDEHENYSHNPVEVIQEMSSSSIHIPQQPYIEDLVVHNLVLHQLKKEMTERTASVVLSDDLLPLTKENIELVDEINKIYFSKHPIFGRFKENEEGEPYSELVKQYCDENISFIQYANSTTEKLMREVNGTNATGGYILYGHYTWKDEEMIFVVILQNNRVFIINENLAVNVGKALNLNGISMASFLNISKWDLAVPTEAYLSFLKGKKDIREYFISTIGCEEIKLPAVNSTNLVNAINAYCDKQGISSDQKKAIRTNIYELAKSLPKDEPIKLTSISAIVNPNSIDDFATFASNDNFQVSGEFSPCMRTLKKLKFITYKKKSGLKIEFPRELFDDETVKYERESRKIVISDIDINIFDELIK